MTEHRDKRSDRFFSLFFFATAPREGQQDQEQLTKRDNNVRLVELARRRTRRAYAASHAPHQPTTLHGHVARCVFAVVCVCRVVVAVLATVMDASLL